MSRRRPMDARQKPFPFVMAQRIGADAGGTGDGLRCEEFGHRDRTANESPVWCSLIWKLRNSCTASSACESLVTMFTRPPAGVSTYVYRMRSFSLAIT